tara:strand:+ start:175 stop:1287 length:1113 start_codon:yes stop_codon:yes gene_type:complete
MRIDNKHWQTIWVDDNKKSVNIIDQTLLPHKFNILNLKKVEDFYSAIKNMNVRGAPLIGVTGAYGLVFAIREDSSNENIQKSFNLLNSARPTAINLKWALERIFNNVINLKENERFSIAFSEAIAIEKEDILMCEKIGDNGKNILKNLLDKKKEKTKDPTLNVLTHCNAGWLATVDWGTALAPIYKAHREGIKLHVWVDETRPRNQGASLTAYELTNEGISNTIIVDNAGGHLMQHSKVDVVIVGSDRTTKSGDVCNKIGTYLKALAAKDNNIPFYVALPFSTIDWDINNGLNEIPIENRSQDEVSHIIGMNSNKEISKVRLIPEGSNCVNPGFDVTPSSLVTALITEKGVAYLKNGGLETLYQSKNQKL